MSDLRTDMQETIWELEEKIQELYDEIATLNELAKLRYCDMQTKIELLEAELEGYKDE